jgi:hypothetical protein
MSSSQSHHCCSPDTCHHLGPLHHVTWWWVLPISRSFPLHLSLLCHPYCALLSSLLFSFPYCYGGKEWQLMAKIMTEEKVWRQASRTEGDERHTAQTVLWQQNSHTAFMHILINIASIEGVWAPEFSLWNFTNSLEFQCLLQTADQTRPFFILFHAESKTVPQTPNLCSLVLHQPVQIQRKSKFYPQNIFLCVVWISERTAAISPHSTNSRICIQWRRSVDIVTYKLNLTEIQVNFSL